MPLTWKKTRHFSDHYSGTLISTYFPFIGNSRILPQDVFKMVLLPLEGSHVHSSGNTQHSHNVCNAGHQKEKRLWKFCMILTFFLKIFTFRWETSSLCFHPLMTEKCVSVKTASFSRRNQSSGNYVNVPLKAWYWSIYYMYEEMSFCFYIF